MRFALEAAGDGDAAELTRLLATGARVNDTDVSVFIATNNSVDAGGQ